MPAFLKVSFLVTALAAALSAKAGARDDDKPAASIESAIRHWLENQHYPGGQVRELLLADPESHGSDSIYLVEFAIQLGSRLVRCEDWRFTVHRVPDGWAILKTERGRCND